jgi:hypothetical protein
MSTETLNRFQRNDQVRAEKRRQSHSLSAKEAVAIRDKKREEWTSHGRSPSQTRGGLLLDEKTLAAQADFAASHKPAEPPPVPQMSAATLESITRDWLSRNPGFYNSDFNRTSMRNFLVKNVTEGRLTPSVEMLDIGFEFLMKHHHLERAPGTPRKRGEVVSSAVVTLFEYTPPEVQAALDQEQAAKAIEQRAKEDAANRNLPLDQLRKKAHAARGTISRESIRVYQG